MRFVTLFAGISCLIMGEYADAHSLHLSVASLPQMMQLDIRVMVRYLLGTMFAQNCYEGLLKRSLVCKMEIAPRCRKVAGFGFGSRCHCPDMGASGSPRKREIEVIYQATRIWSFRAPQHFKTGAECRIQELGDTEQK